MYYSSGNYEAFAIPKKPEGVDAKSAYLIGSGLAALSAACFLVRDGQMKGEHVHILEKDPIPGGACDGYKYQDIGYVMRGGREMDNHFECMWDLFRSIPSIEDENYTVLDEYYWLNKADPNYSLCRATVNRGQDAHTDGKFGLSDKGAMEILQLFMTPDEKLYDKKITDFFDDEVLNTNFWMYWRTMFAFENWHSALEMKRYLQRYIHHIGGLPDFTALRFTRYNQYESMILPMVKYLESFGVQFHYNTKVVNVAFDCAGGKKQATRIDILRDGREARRAVLGDSAAEIRAVLFDFDDTLQDRSRAFDKFTAFFMDKYFPHLSGEEKARRGIEMRERNNGGYVNYIDYFASLVESWRWEGAPEVGDLYREFQFRFPECSTLFPETKEVLTELRRRGFLLGIVTNGPSIQQNRKLDVAGLRPFVDLCMVSGDEQVHKPDPEIFRRAASRLGVACGSCLYVGDHPVNDIEGAAAAGMRPVYINAARRDFHPDNVIEIHSLRELLDVV